MNFRKNSTLIIGLGSALVLFGIALFFLIRNQSAYNESQTALTTAKNRLTSLNNRNPFPSQENIDQTREQIASIKTNYVAIMETLQKEQISTEPIEPARFAQLLEVAARRIRDKALAEGVVLPADPGLGFKEYVAGKLPPNNPAVMDRLVIQIKTIENLFTHLINAKVVSIDAIQREQFENSLSATQNQGDSPAAPVASETDTRRRGFVVGRDSESETSSSPGGIPAAPKAELYTTERFTIEFTARESAVWDMINRLGSSKIAYAVVDLKLSNTALDVGKPVDLKSKLVALTSTAMKPMGMAPAGNTAMPPPAIDSLSREERVVAGREPIKVKIVVDMYRFVNGVAGEVGQ